MNIKEVIRIMYNGLTDKQKKFWDSFISNGKNMKATIADLKITEPMGYLLKKHTVISIMLDLLENKIVEQKEMPTLMWTLGEYVKMYDGVVKRIKEIDSKGDKSGDEYELLGELEDKQRALLKDIKDYQKAFGEAIDEDDLKISQMPWKELVKYFGELKGDIELRLAEGNWVEQC